MLKSYETLLSIHLIEERMDDVDEFMVDEIEIIGSSRYLWRWTYPSIDNDVRFFIEKRLAISSSSSSSSSLSTIFTYDYGKFTFYKIREKFIYILTNQSKRFSFVLLTIDFYPKYYQKLLKIFAEIFLTENSIQKLLNEYLTLIIMDRIEVMINDNGDDGKRILYFQRDNCIENEFDMKKLQSQLRSIIKMFSLDVILIYTALLLKKRIIIYGNDTRTLFEFVMALPLFIQHRLNMLDEQFIPNVDLQCPEQINDLKCRENFLSTFNDPRIEEHEDLYDVYINLATIEITISHRAKETFMMTKTHKDVAITFVRVAEKQSSTDQDVVDEISKKTNELLNNLYSSSSLVDDDNSVIRKSRLKEKFSSPNVEQFFFNLAMAECLPIVNDT
ncbi:DENN domain-containing protein 10 [Dermatophagoides farinae]|uniref:DENN domain-containing protein 10 n=1 Tax=Dermatophagoides farinae TaxID=6954 RepID=UPI003F608A3C